MGKFRKIYDKYALSTFSLGVFIIFWQLGSVFKFLPVDYIGTPSRIIVEFVKLLTPQIFLDYLLPSIEALVLGLGLSLLFGVLFGILIGLNDTIRKAFNLFLVAVNAIPMIVFFPLLILSFGISLWSVVLTIILMCLVPIVINVIEGMKNTDPNLLAMAKSFGASKSFILKNVTFYSTIPFILASAKSSIGKSITALIVAEIYGLNKGVGYLVSYYGTTFQADRLMAIVLFIMLLNGILFSILWFASKNLKINKGER